MPFCCGDIAPHELRVCVPDSLCNYSVSGTPMKSQENLSVVVNLPSCVPQLEPVRASVNLESRCATPEDTERYRDTSTGASDARSKPKRGTSAGVEPSLCHSIGHLVPTPPHSSAPAHATHRYHPQRVAPFRLLHSSNFHYRANRLKNKNESLHVRKETGLVSSQNYAGLSGKLRLWPRATDYHTPKALPHF